MRGKGTDLSVHLLVILQPRRSLALRCMSRLRLKQQVRVLLEVAPVEGGSIGDEGEIGRGGGEGRGGGSRGAETDAGGSGSVVKAFDPGAEGELVL